MLNGKTANSPRVLGGYKGGGGNMKIKARSFSEGGFDVLASITEIRNTRYHNCRKSILIASKV